MKTRVVGVDIRLSKTTCAVVDIGGNILDTNSFATADYPIVGDYVSVLCQHILTLVEANGGYESIRSVGISAPSGNFMEGSMVNSPNMPWKGVVPLAAMLRDQLGLAVALANNAHVTALGAHAFGAAHGMRNFAVVNIGSGVGSCFFSEGRVHIGSDGFAGELGHICLVHDGRQCGCGNKGCLEAYCSAKGIMKTAQELLAESDKPSMLRSLDKVTPEEILNCCEKGDELSIEIYRRTGEWLGLGLATYASILDPEAFIFAGWAAVAGKWLLEPANESFEKHVFHNIENQVKFIASKQDSAIRNILGASVLAWEVKEYSLFK